MEYYIGNLNDGYNFYAKEFFSVLLLTDKRRNQNWIINQYNHEVQGTEKEDLE